jgi:hypothetical protein
VGEVELISQDGVESAVGASAQGVQGGER